MSVLTLVTGTEFIARLGTEAALYGADVASGRERHVVPDGAGFYMHLKGFGIAQNVKMPTCAGAAH